MVNHDPLPRRHLIRAGALGLATGLAGCNDGMNVRQPDNPNPGGTTTPPPGTDGGQHEMPETPPAVFKGPTTQFELWNMPVHEELTDPNDLTQFGAITGAHPDNAVFDIEVQNETTARLTIEQTIVTRPFDLTLYVRDATNTYHERTARIEETDDQFTTIIHEFSLANISIPTMKGGFMELVAEDSHPGNPYTFLAKRHQYVGIPHKNGVEWLNSRTFNHRRFTKNGGAHSTDPRGVTINGEMKTKREEPAGAIKTIDGNNERTVLMAVRTAINGEVYGVSCHIDHDPYNRYKTGSDRTKYLYGPQYECRFATDISHFRELATKTDSAIRAIGLSDSHERLQALGDLVQMLPYTFHGDDPPGTVVLYESKGDCSSKSMLLSCILQNDPWNVMPAYIDCSINGIGHWTLGLDVDDFGGASGFTVAPTNQQVSQGFPDTDYAFWDMTYDSNIGQRTDGVEGPFKIYDEGDFRHNPGRSSDNPPNY